MSDPGNDAIGELLASYEGSMLRRARRLLRSDIDAEDAVQTVMLAVLEAPHLLADVERIGAWLTTLVGRKCADIIRTKVRRRAKESDEFVDGIHAGADEISRKDRDELMRRLQAAIDALPPEQREVFVANAIDGTTFRELAERTGEPMGTLMARKKRAADRIRAALARDGYDVGIQD